jgi:hypothetical protein
MNFTGKPMKGYVYVAQEGLRGRAALAKWIDRAQRFVATLARATPKKTTRPRAKGTKTARKTRRARSG